MLQAMLYTCLTDALYHLFKMLYCKRSCTGCVETDLDPKNLFEKIIWNQQFLCVFNLLELKLFFNCVDLQIWVPQKQNNIQFSGFPTRCHHFDPALFLQLWLLEYEKWKHSAAKC